MTKLVAKQKIGFRNPETGEIVTAEPYAFSTLPDWVEKDPMYGWALADGTIEVGSEPKEGENMMRPPAEGDGAKKEPKASKSQKKDAGADKQQEGDSTPPAEGDGAKKE